MTARDRVAVVALTGGLGNQMFQYAAARAFCLREARRLRLAWELTRKEGERRYALDAFRLGPETEVSRLAAADASRLGLGAPAWKRWIGLAPAVEVFREASFRYAAIRARESSVVLEGFFQSCRHFEDHAAAIREDFSFAAPPAERNAELLAEIAGGNAIAMHVRRGDYVHDERARAKHGTLPLEYHRRALEVLGPATERATVYVFSDEPGYARTHLDLGLPTRFVDRNGPEDAAEDLRLMAACRHFVIANSTLSWWGAWLGGARDKRVVAPARWFAGGGLDVTDLYPAGWLLR